MIIALAGGVGGARLAQGLAAVLPPDRLTIVVNTGDDFEHLGLSISPDVDTVMYTLAGIADRERGWGQAGETWAFMSALKALGGEDWFLLGDKDLATHVERTRRLRSGETLSTITKELCRRLGMKHAMVPMSDDPVRTFVDTESGALAFQDYFVRRRCEPAVRRIDYVGANKAKPSPYFRSLMDSRDIEGVVICPSNPLLSVAPILALPGVRPWLETRAFPVVAVSPIIGGQAVKGPAAKILRELGFEPSASTIASFYKGLIDGIVIDSVDHSGNFGVVAVHGTNALMKDEPDRTRLARETLTFLGSLRRPR